MSKRDAKIDGYTALERYGGDHFYNISKLYKIISVIDFRHRRARTDVTRMITIGSPDRMIFYTSDYTDVHRDRAYFLALSAGFDEKFNGTFR